MHCKLHPLIKNGLHPFIKIELYPFIKIEWHPFIKIKLWHLFKIKHNWNNFWVSDKSCTEYNRLKL